MNYAELFGLRVTHTYYDDGRCPDFEIEPTPETRRLLKNHRFMWKPLPDGGRVVATVESDRTAFLPLARGVAFAFVMRVRSPELPLFTDLARVSAQPAPLFTSVGSVGGSLTLGTRRGSDPGRPSPAHPPGVFAEIEILNDDALPGPAEPLPARAPEYRVALEAKTARWVYYFVTNAKPEPPIADLAVAHDRGPDAAPLADDPQFSGHNAARLGEADPDDPLVEELAGRYAGLSRYRFLSDTAVPCRQSPRSTLVLRRGQEPLVKPLPNPSIRDFSTIEIAAGATPDTKVSAASLFHVIKHVTATVA